MPGRNILSTETVRNNNYYCLESKSLAELIQSKTRHKVISQDKSSKVGVNVDSSQLCFMCLVIT